MREEQSVAQSPAEAAAGTSAVGPLVLPQGPPREYFSRRFLIVYATLGLIFVGSVVGLIGFGIRPGFGNSQSWSRWKPSSGSLPAVAKQIADHVAPNYRLPNGAQIVAVVPSTPAVTAGTANIAIAAIALRSNTSPTTDVQTVTPGRTQMYTLCGLGMHCSIASGQPSLTRGRLVHREGLEAALYTFKYVPAIESVIVFMPPAKGATSTTVLYYQKENLSGVLSHPLSKTLPLAIPPRSDREDATEAPTIDALTLPHLYTSTLTQLQAGGALLVLTPVERF